MPARYKELLRTPYVARLLVTSMLARLPQGMGSLAVLLLLSPRLGYGRAGLASGVSIATAGASSVLLARAVDRYGVRIVLLPTALAYAAASWALAADRHGGYAGIVAICAAIGLATPPVTAVARGLWPTLLGREQAQILYGLEATAQELVFIAGPALVAVIAGLAGRATAVVATGLAGLLGVVAYVTAPPLAGRGHRGARQHHRVLLGTGLASFVAAAVCITIGLTMTDVAIVDFTGGRTSSTAAGVILAIWSAGSMVGGVWFGARVTAASDNDWALARSIALMAAGIAVAAASPGRIGLGILVLVGGVTVAPAFARLYSRIGSVTSEGATTEAFSWLAVGFLVGSAAGSGLGGATCQAWGARAGFLLAATAIGLGGAVIRLGRPGPDR